MNSYDAVFESLNNEVFKGYTPWLGVTGTTDDEAVATAIEKGNIFLASQKKKFGTFFFLSQQCLFDYLEQLPLGSANFRILACLCFQNKRPQNNDMIFFRAVQKLRKKLAVHGFELGMDEEGFLCIDGQVDLERMTYISARTLRPEFTETCQEVAGKNKGIIIKNIIQNLAYNGIDHFHNIDFINNLSKKTIKQLKDILQNLEENK